MREVRFSVLPVAPAQQVITNSWAGWPGSAALTPQVAVRAHVAGPVDAGTGYLVNIACLDEILRATAIPPFAEAWAQAGGRPVEPAGLLRGLWDAVGERLTTGALERLELRVTPYLRYALGAGDLSMVQVTQSFEFAAAHRLYVPDLSAEENRRIFGKCTNPNGHGHNYVLEVTVAGPPDPTSGAVLSLPEFEAVVKERVIDRFDHRHLNADCAEFATLNPSVENITRVIWELLAGAFGRCRLHTVRVWETPKTYAEYHGE